MCLPWGLPMILVSCVPCLPVTKALWAAATLAPQEISARPVPSSARRVRTACRFRRQRSSGNPTLATATTARLATDLPTATLPGRTRRRSGPGKARMAFCQKTELPQSRCRQPWRRSLRIQLQGVEIWVRNQSSMIKVNL